MRPDGPPFITLDVSDKLLEMGVTSKGFREITLRLGVPVLVCLVAALLLRVKSVDAEVTARYPDDTLLTPVAGDRWRPTHRANRLRQEQARPSPASAIGQAGPRLIAHQK